MTNKPSGQRHLERFPTHVPGLDTILGGGLFAGGVYFVQGAPGVGKTTLANQICFRHVASGGRAVYATLLTESHDRLLQHLRRQSFFAADAIATSLFYVSAFRHLENAGLKGLVELIQREVTTRQATLLVLDGLMLAVESVDSDRELRLFVHEVQTLATMIGCTVLLLTSGSRTVPRAEQTMVEGILELEDRLVGSRSERQIQIRKFRGGRVERGTHAFCITDDGIEIYPRLESRIDRGGPPVASAGEPLATGVPGLDRALGGRGVARGSATLISGGTGTGKTSIGLHFLAGASDESPAVMFGFFDPPDALMAMAERYRLPLAPLRKRGLLTLDWRELGDETLDELGHRMLKAIDSHSAKRVVVDSITAFFNASSFPERGHRFAGALLNEFRRREVTSMFMLEPRDEPQVGLSASTEGIGKFFDNVVSLRFVDDGTRLRRQLSVIKVRRGPVDDRKLEVEIGAAGVSVINPERHPG